MTRRINLSYDISVRALKWKQGDPQQFRVRDSNRMGFYIRVSKNGAKTWEYRYPIGGGKYRYLKLGNYPYLSCADALEKFKLAVEDVKVTGVDPKQVMTRKSLTLNELFEQYLERYAKKHKKSWKEDENLYRLHVNRLIPVKIGDEVNEINIGKKRAASISREDIGIIIGELESDENSKLHTARKTLAVLRKMFNWAADRTSAPSNGHGVLLDMSNPCNGVTPIKPPPSEKHDLQVEVIRTIWHDLPDTSVGRIVKLLLLTGCRVGEVAGIHSREIDRETNDLIIPSKRTKNGRTHVIPLTPRMLEIIGSETAGQIFPADSITGHTDMSSVRNHLRKACLRLEIDHIRPSDFRDTFISKLTKLGIHLEVRNSLTNHKDTSVDRVNYNDYDFYREKKDALIRWDDEVTKMLKMDD